MFQNGDGKNGVERVRRQARQSRAEILTHDFYARKLFHVALVIGRAVAKSIIRIHQGNFVAELGQKSAHDGLAATDLEEARGRRDIRKNCFRGPGPLHVLQIAVDRGDLRKLIETFAIVAHRCVRRPGDRPAPGKAGNDGGGLRWILKEAQWLRHRFPLEVWRRPSRKTRRVLACFASYRNVRERTKARRPRVVRSALCLRAVPAPRLRCRARRLYPAPRLLRDRERSVRCSFAEEARGGPWQRIPAASPAIEIR